MLERARGTQVRRDASRGSEVHTLPSPDLTSWLIEPSPDFYLPLLLVVLVGDLIVVLHHLDLLGVPLWHRRFKVKLDGCAANEPSAEKVVFEFTSLIAPAECSLRELGLWGTALERPQARPVDTDSAPPWTTPSPATAPCPTLSSWARCSRAGQRQSTTLANVAFECARPETQLALFATSTLAACCCRM